jgi:hypothetical protein
MTDDTAELLDGEVNISGGASGHRQICPWLGGGTLVSK